MTGLQDFMTAWGLTKLLGVSENLRSFLKCTYHQAIGSAPGTEYLVAGLKHMDNCQNNTVLLRKPVKFYS